MKTIKEPLAKRQIAIIWWNSLDATEQCTLAKEYGCFKSASHISGREVQNIAEKLKIFKLIESNFEILK